VNQGGQSSECVV